MDRAQRAKNANRRAAVVGRTLLWGALACAGWPTAFAQYQEDDARDRLVTVDGKERAGRLLWEWDPRGDVEWLDPKGRVDRVARERVLQIETVTDRVGAWLAARSPRATLEEEWALLEYAVDSGLDGLADAQAYHILSRDPNHAAAHGHLGHLADGSRWRWRLPGEKRHLDAEQWAAHHADSGHPLVLRSEHYVLRTTADVGRAVDLLFDLEKVYCEFQREFQGLDGLQPREVVRRPMDYWVFRDEEQFPALTSAKRGYYLPGLGLTASSETPFVGSGNEVVTYFAARGAHPESFFALAAQQLLYNCVLGEKQGAWAGEEWGLYREAASLEVGFGNWFGSQFSGRPGYVTRGSFALSAEDAAIARRRADVYPLDKTRSELTNLIGLNYEFFHKNEDEKRSQYHARANAFFGFLMDPTTILPEGQHRGRSARSAILTYMREVYLTPSGGSSSKLDDALGMRVEDLEPLWREWLQKF
jgi:hypothetical protein